MRLLAHSTYLLLAPLGFLIGELSYATLDGTAEPLKATFNADRGKVRLLMYVSPTCGECLRGAKQTQQRVLAVVPDSTLAVYVVWAPKNGARQIDVNRVTGIVTDARARQYWDEHRVVTRAYDDMLALTGPCAGLFLLYGPEARWDGTSPPRPASVEDAHAHEFNRASPQFDANRLAEEVRTLLAKRRA